MANRFTTVPDPDDPGESKPSAEAYDPYDPEALRVNAFGMLKSRRS